MSGCMYRNSFVLFLREPVHAQTHIIQCTCNSRTHASFSPLYTCSDVYLDVYVSLDIGGIIFSQVFVSFIQRASFD